MNQNHKILGMPPKKAAQHERVDGFQVPEHLRIPDACAGIAGTNHGMFSVLSKDLSIGSKRTLIITAHKANAEWQHIEVIAAKAVDKNLVYKTPTYFELCQARQLFWDDSRVVMLVLPNEQIDLSPQMCHIWSHVGMFPVPEDELMLMSDDKGDELHG